MRLLVVGGSGMLGSDLVTRARERGHDVVAPTHGELDVTDPLSIAEAAESTIQGANWCINCAAYTAVDLAESEEQAAAELNALGPGYLARACAMASVPIVHVSTDFVFDGTAREPYDEDAETRPLGLYGRTKLAGEQAVRAGNMNSLIVRTSWLYGPNGKSFPKTMINAWKAGKVLRVVSDQVGSPTYTADLARVLVDLVEQNAYPGVYHATGPDAMSWFDFARLTLETCRDVDGEDRPVEIAPIRTEEWPTPAKRPAYSVLSNRRLRELGISPMRPTAEALKEFCERLRGGGRRSNV